VLDHDHRAAAVDQPVEQCDQVVDVVHVQAGGSPVLPGTGTQIDHSVGDRDHLRLVLGHQHRVSLVTQAEQEVVHVLDVAWVQADRRLVEDVGEVSEAGAEVPNHLHSLGHTAGQGAGFAIQARIAQPDPDQVVQGRLQIAQQRRDLGGVEVGHEQCQIADLHGRALGDVSAGDPRGQRRLIEPGPLAVRALARCRNPLDGCPQGRLLAVEVLAPIQPSELVDQTLIGQRVLGQLDLGLRPVQELFPLGRGVVAQ